MAAREPRSRWPVLCCLRVRAVSHHSRHCARDARRVLLRAAPVLAAAARRARRCHRGGAGPGRRVRLAQGALGVAVVAVLIGVSNAYYALMLMPLLAVAAAIGALRSDRGRRLAVVASAAVIAALVLGSILVNNLPALRYQSAHGKNPEVDVRYPWEVDRLRVAAGRVAQSRARSPRSRAAHPRSTPDDIAAACRSRRNSSVPSPRSACSSRSASPWL